MLALQALFSGGEGGNTRVDTMSNRTLVKLGCKWEKLMSGREGRGRERMEAGGEVGEKLPISFSHLMSKCCLYFRTRLAVLSYWKFIEPCPLLFDAVTTSLLSTVERDFAIKPRIPCEKGLLTQVTNEQTGATRMVPSTGRLLMRAGCSKGVSHYHLNLRW